MESIGGFVFYGWDAVEVRQDIQLMGFLIVRMYSIDIPMFSYHTSYMLRLYVRYSIDSSNGFVSYFVHAQGGMYDKIFN